MRTASKAGNLLPMTVTEGITVNVMPSEDHEFLINTKDVAIGYGVTEYNIRQHKLMQSSELIDGKHFISSVSIPNAAYRGTHKATMWTKRGIVRLGFFIKSERAKLFRDWAEDLILKIDEQKDLFGDKVAFQKKLPAKRKHNRLTQERMVSIMADVCMIENAALRVRLVNKLMGRAEA
jgi:hypothetical protein